MRLSPFLGGLAPDRAVGYAAPAGLYVELNRKDRLLVRSEKMSPKKRSRQLTIYVLSGSTGRTCDEVLGAALAQFDQPNVRIVHKVKIRSAKAATAAVQEAAELGAVICHSLVAPRVREAVVEETNRLRVPTVGILGPVLTLLEDHLGQTPRLRPGLSYQLQKERLDRFDAVDFTLCHDDGCGLADLDRADVVVVGVSRASKSVTCFYLAYRGIRAANVPLIPGSEPPSQLLAIDPHKVIGLTMNANRLSSLREARIQTMGNVDLAKYGGLEDIRRELKYANSMIDKHGWRKIDVSYKSVEEVAKEIVSMIEA
jgi:regulator of PEP synthase PpsR (kinase-PPPase family)